jgi:hypothetical protein
MAAAAAFGLHLLAMVVIAGWPIMTADRAVEQPGFQADLAIEEVQPAEVGKPSSPPPVSPVHSLPSSPSPAKAVSRAMARPSSVDGGTATERPAVEAIVPDRLDLGLHQSFSAEERGAKLQGQTMAARRDALLASADEQKRRAERDDLYKAPAGVSLEEVFNFARTPGDSSWFCDPARGKGPHGEHCLAVR